MSTNTPSSTVKSPVPSSALRAISRTLSEHSPSLDDSYICICGVAYYTIEERLASEPSLEAWGKAVDRHESPFLEVTLRSVQARVLMTAAGDREENAQTFADGADTLEDSELKNSFTSIVDTSRATATWLRERAQSVLSGEI